jgi:hypothetical protein
VQETPAAGGTCSDTSYEGEAMTWSGVTGTDGEIRTTPAPAHRYVWQDSYVSQSHPFLAQPMRIRVTVADGYVVYRGTRSLFAAHQSWAPARRRAFLLREIPDIPIGCGSSGAARMPTRTIT